MTTLFNPYCEIRLEYKFNYKRVIDISDKIDNYISDDLKKFLDDKFVNPSVKLDETEDMLDSYLWSNR